MNNNIAGAGALVRGIWSLIAVVCCVQHTQAEEIRDYYAEPGLNPFKDVLNQSLNEHLDPFSGTLQLKYTDLTVPGNGGMDINITRVYTSLQDSDVPLIGINGVGWVMHFGRIVTAQRNMGKLCNQALFSASTNDNPSLELPDGGRELLVLNDIEGDGSLITRSNWKAVCVAGHSGLQVTSPDGTKYTMDYGTYLQSEPSWMTTRIEDVHGNWIRIDYATNSAGISYITEIYRSEEGGSDPVVTYEYEEQDGPGIVLAAIVANGQRWTYEYESIPGYFYDHYHHLVGVRRPDGRQWSYAYYPAPQDQNPDPDVIELTPGGHSLRQMRYPFGATVDYTYQYVQFDPGSALKTTAIATKVVSGGDVPNGQWQFTFAPHSRPYMSSTGYQLRYDVTTVTAPGQIYRYAHYGKDYIGLPGGGQAFVRPTFVGLLAFKEVYSAADVLLERRAYAWTDRLISNENFWHGAGYRDWWTEPATYAPMLAAEAYNRDGSVGNAAGYYQHAKFYYDYDAYGNPGRVYENVNLTNQLARQVVFTYRNDLTRWILGLPLTETHQTVTAPQGGAAVTVGQVTRTYFTNGELQSENRFGVETEYTYTPAGDIASVEDARGYVRNYSGYRRGIARREELPESVVVLREVNDTGTLQSETNGRGFTTSYTYDDLNRLTSIDYPINADVTIAYGDQGGATRRVLTRGNYRQVELINDFGQTQRTERTELSTNETISKTMTFDALGRQTFVSYPNDTIGLQTTYDSLGRIRRTEHPDSTGVDYTYDDQLVTVQNELRNSTTYLYRIFGIDEAAQEPHLITQPLNVATRIDRDTFGNTTRVLQGTLSGSSISGYSKAYQYDSRQFLTQASELEVGTTTYTHDALGNVLTESVNLEPATTFTWDALGRRVAVNFGDATPDVATVFDKNGNIIELSKGPSRWNYVYDDNDNLQSETLSVQDQWFGARSYSLSYAINPMDVVSSVTYPSGLVAQYAPDAFGRATRVGTFATNVQYHPSGQLRSYTLGNGVVTTVQLNQRLLTQRIQSGPLLDMNYTYDNGGNLSAMTDAIDPSQSNTDNFYDALDRLTFASGPWGGLSPQYDAVGNFTARTTATDTYLHSNDTRARLAQIERTRIYVNGDFPEITQFGYDSRGNINSKRVYRLLPGGQLGFTRKIETKLRFDAASNLTTARVLDSSASAVVTRQYAYDGNGMRYAERQGKGHALQHSIYGASKTLLFEDSLAECTRTEYLLLGALNIAKSSDSYANAAQDSDGDGLNDCIETQVGLNPQNPADAAGDLDGDGLTNLEEYSSGSSPLFADTDQDGLNDAVEAAYGTDPFANDSDGDGISDADEIADSRLNANAADSDHDGVTDDWELRLGSDPSNPLDATEDFDNDGFSNRQERWVDVDPMNLGRSPGRGVIAWRHDVGDTLQSLPTIGPDGSIYVAHEASANPAGGNVRAIYPDGTLRWNEYAPGSKSGPVTVGPDGAIYYWVRTIRSGSILFARNPDGSPRWSYTNTMSSFHSPISLGRNGELIIGGGRGTGEGAVSTIDQNGVLVSTKLVAQLVTVAPVIAPNGSMFVMSGNGTLHAYQSSGAPAWTYSMRAVSNAELSLGRNGVIYVVDTLGYTTALRPNGTLLWEQRHSTAALRSSVTVGSSGMLYVGTAVGTILALRESDGATMWSGFLGSNPILTPVVGKDGTVYAVSSGGRISAYDATGALVWSMLSGSLINAAATMDKDGTLYVGTMRGQLLGIVDRSGGLPPASWPMQRHDAAGSAFQCFNSDSYNIAGDADGDGIDDCDEFAYGLDPNDPSDGPLDLDGDGLSNAEESGLGTRLDVADTDGDGVTDGQEVRIYNTDPLSADTDGDTLSDGFEVQYQFDPLDPAEAFLDTDNDGFSNRQEMLGGTDPLSLSSAPVGGTIVLTESRSTFPVRQPSAHPDGAIYVNGQNQLEARGPDLSLRWIWADVVVEGQPTVGSNGIVYAVTKPISTLGQHTVMAFYPDGKIWWSQPIVETSGSRYDGPVIGNDGSVYVSYRVYGTYAEVIGFTADGRPLGRYEHSSSANRQSRLSVDLNGNVLFTLSTMISLNPTLSTRNWTSNVPAAPVGAISVPIVDSTGIIYITRSDGLYAISSANGAMQWRNADAVGQPVITETGLIVATCASTGQLCAFNRDGTLAWQMQGTYSLLGAPAVDSNNLIHQVARNGWYLRVSASGQLESQIAIPSITSFEYPLILGDGMVYLGMPGANMLVLNGAAGAGASPWPTKNRDMTNRRNASAPSMQPLPEGPAVSWVSPPPSTMYYRDNLTVTARAFDYEDGDVSAAIQWSSNLDGSVGMGATINLQVLNAGRHTVTATIQDTDGHSSSSSFAVTVGHQPPKLTVIAPEWQTRAEIGYPVHFRATAIDTVDGDISAAIRWSSEHEGGLIGTGGDFSAVLRPGYHWIQVVSLNSRGLGIQEAVNVTVEHLVPALTIVMPAVDQYVFPGTELTFAATAIDVVDGDLTNQIRWNSTLDGALHIGEGFSTATLSVGQHRIYARATDSHNRIGEQYRFVSVQSSTGNSLPSIYVWFDGVGGTSFGTPVSFSAEAWDDEDGGDLTNIQWYSNRDGAIGTGPQFTISTLSVGTHEITGVVTDSEGAKGSSSVEYRVSASSAVARASSPRWLMRAPNRSRYAALLWPHSAHVGVAR